MSGLMSRIWKRSNSCCHRARSRLYYAVDAGRLPLTTGLHGSPQDRSYQATCVTIQFQRLRNRALTITCCSSRSCARELISCGSRGELLVTEFVGFEGFIVNFVKRGDATVPFGQCGSVANELDGMRVHLFRPGRAPGGSWVSRMQLVSVAVRRWSQKEDQVRRQSYFGKCNFSSRY